jgi:adenylosuccinate synthase
MRQVTVVCDLQFGSTGKGLIAGYLAERDKPDTVVTAWSMNAGHTYINRDGRKFVHCMLANGIVSPNLRQVLIGPGSQIGLDRLFAEIEECQDLLQGVQIIIHENACVIQERHILEEGGSMTAIGSTKKGCGAAMIEKIRRNPESVITARDFTNEVLAFSDRLNIDISTATSENYNKALDRSENVLVEGAQGYSLGINSGFYPYTTSRECTPAQIMVDAGVPMRWLTKIVGTMRTYPIRVANRFNKDGEMIGWSGPCYSDQKEITFNDLGQPVELTTVTQLPRRIFTFSRKQTEDALRAVQPDEVFLNFVNYCRDEQHSAFIVSVINNVANNVGCGGVKYLGFGPTFDNVREL